MFPGELNRIGTILKQALAKPTVNHRGCVTGQVRRQSDLCFKEWKSYGSLHTFDTANPHIGTGPIQAILCAAPSKNALAQAALRVGKRIGQLRSGLVLVGGAQGSPMNASHGQRETQRQYRTRGDLTWV